MVDTFYAIGLVMRVCQSISLLELLHICVGIEPNHLLPRFLQVGGGFIYLFFSHVIDCNLYAVFFIPVTYLITGSLNLLISCIYFTHPPNQLSSGSHQLALCILESVWGWFLFFFFWFICFLGAGYKSNDVVLCFSL